MKMDPRCSGVSGFKPLPFLNPHPHPNTPHRSLGGGPTWPASGPDAVANEAFANLVYAGLVVSVSAGNSGGITGLAAGGTGLCESRNPTQYQGSEPGTHTCILPLQAISLCLHACLNYASRAVPSSQAQSTAPFSRKLGCL